MRRFSIYLLIALIILLLPFMISAQSLFGPGATYNGNPNYNPSATYNSGAPGQIQNPLGNNGPDDLWQFINAVLRTVAKIGAVVVVFFIIFAGFKYVTAQGNEEKLKSAHKTFLYTMIGAAILLGATLLATVIQGTITSLR